MLSKFIFLCLVITTVHANPAWECYIQRSVPVVGSGAWLWGTTDSAITNKHTSLFPAHDVALEEQVAMGVQMFHFQVHDHDGLLRVCHSQRDLLRVFGNTLRMNASDPDALCLFGAAGESSYWPNVIARLHNAVVQTQTQIAVVYLDLRMDMDASKRVWDDLRERLGTQICLRPTGTPAYPSHEQMLRNKCRFLFLSPQTTAWSNQNDLSWPLPAAYNATRPGLRSFQSTPDCDLDTWPVGSLMFDRIYDARLVSLMHQADIEHFQTCGMQPLFLHVQAAYLAQESWVWRNASVPDPCDLPEGDTMVWMLDLAAQWLEVSHIPDNAEFACTPGPMDGNWTIVDLATSRDMRCHAQTVREVDFILDAMEAGNYLRIFQRMPSPKSSELWCPTTPSYGAATIPIAWPPSAAAAIQNVSSHPCPNCTAVCLAMSKSKLKEPQEWYSEHVGTSTTAIVLTVAGVALVVGICFVLVVRTIRRNRRARKSGDGGSFPLGEQEETPQLDDADGL